MIRVVVGSKNPSKIEGVKRAYETFNIETEIVPVEAESRVSRQPRSLDETVRGALNRALSAREKIDGDEYVGVESGLMHIPYIDRIVDVTVAVICDRQLRITVGLSPAFEVPPDFVRRLYGEDLELEDLVVQITGIENIGEKGGFISFLTNGRYERSELVRQAVLMALTPRVCPIKRMYRME
ncbi:MAG: inosine/xanthosine triphosphatase [Crenarchaeota archaeon]|nr:inosine/xanthosine triphosphatase [Thermoproteota archaeon]